MARLDIPSVELSANLYLPDGSVTPVEAEISDLEKKAMGLCLELGELALQDGNPPIGAVLLDRKRNVVHGSATTVDKTMPTILGHAEIRAYMEAEPTVGDDLRECTLVTTAQPCNTCTSPYAEGKIGKIIYAAPRKTIFEVSGLMRPRKINMPDLLADGDTETVVVEGLSANQALKKFVKWGKIQKDKATDPNL